MIKSQIFSSLLGLIKSSFALNNQFYRLEYHVDCDKVRWQDDKGGHSVDVMTFCCEAVVDKVSDLLMQARASVTELPSYGDLFQMIITDIRQYVEQMRGIISCV